MAVSIHEALNPISWLAGKWVTQNGIGKYPTIPEFSYCEELEFTCIGQPMFNFQSKSWHPEKLNPMHQERGFLRIKPGSNELAFVIGHNFGLTSIEEGTINMDKKEINLKTLSLNRISFAKEPSVTKFERSYKLIDDDTLEFTLFMETEKTPLCEHLKATYKKQ